MYSNTILTWKLPLRCSTSDWSQGWVELFNLVYGLGQFGEHNWSKVVVIVRLFNDTLGHSYSASGHTDCMFLLVAHIARYWSANHTWHTRFLDVPRDIFPGKNQFILSFNNLVDVRGRILQSLVRWSSVLPLSQIPSLNWSNTKSAALTRGVDV